jgi:hypothetical protein
MKKKKKAKQSKYIARTGLQHGDRYSEFWMDILEGYEGRMDELAENMGIPYRNLYTILCRPLRNLRVVDCIKVARAAGTDPDKFYYLLHKYFYNDSASQPIRGFEW